MQKLSKRSERYFCKRFVKSSLNILSKYRCLHKIEKLNKSDFCLDDQITAGDNWTKSDIAPPICVSGNFQEVYLAKLSIQNNSKQSMVIVLGVALVCPHFLLSVPLEHRSKMVWMRNPCARWQRHELQHYPRSTCETLWVHGRAPYCLSFSHGERVHWSSVQR